jgi:hypothetical protein
MGKTKRHAALVSRTLNAKLTGVFALNKNSPTALVIKQKIRAYISCWYSALARKMLQWVSMKIADVAEQHRKATVE